MLEQVDQSLEEWAGKVLPGVPVSLVSAPQPARQPSLGFYLLQLAPVAPPQGVRAPAPFKIKLCYLVTAWAESPAEMHRLVGTLMFSAMENSEWEVVSSASFPRLWSDLNLPLRPAFGLWVPVTRERQVRRAPLVKSQLVLKQSAMRTLRGQVLGPAQVPIMGATIEVPALGLATMTDRQGRFHFSAVPGEPPIRVIRVNAKGRAVTKTVERTLAPDEPLVIQLNEREIEYA